MKRLLYILIFFLLLPQAKANVPEVAGAVGDIVANTNYVEQNYPKLKNVIDIYNGAMGLIGIKNLVTSDGVVNLYKNADKAIKEAFEQKTGIKANLTAYYLNWKTAATNLDNLTDAERQLVNEQEQVWKTLLGTLPENTYLYNPNMADRIRQIVLNSGESMEKFVNINYKAANGLASADEITWLQNFVTKNFSKPTVGDKLRKVIDLDNMKKWQLGIDNTSFIEPSLPVGGFVTKMDDYYIPHSSAELIENLRLDYSNTPFSADKGFVIIEFKNQNSFDIEHPFNTNRANNPLPFTNTGMTGSKTNIIPEYVN